jgi:hypothetical protein
MNGKDFMERFQEKVNRPTFEKTHKRATFLVEKELLERLERLVAEQPRGFKTALINEALRRLLDEIESNE